MSSEARPTRELCGMTQLQCEGRERQAAAFIKRPSCTLLPIQLILRSG
jgi:hypothetical protein